MSEAIPLMMVESLPWGNQTADTKSFKNSLLVFILFTCTHYLYLLVLILALITPIVFFSSRLSLQNVAQVAV